MDIVSSNTGAGLSTKRTGIVLLHGLTGTSVEMKPLQKHFEKIGFDVENVLLAGHGGDHHKMIDSTWTQWMDSARQAMKGILLRNDRVIICGLSMGALIAASLAAEENRVSALVMLSPTLSYDGSIKDNNVVDSIVGSTIARNLMRFAVKSVPALGKMLFWEESPPYGIRDERIQKQITKSIEAARAGANNEYGVFRTYYASFRQMWDLVDHVRASFSTIKCPVLMMHSLDDTLVSIHNATETYLNLGSNNKALFMLTGCDHVMTLDLQRQLVQKTIASFVQAYSEFSCEFRTVRSVITPVLQEAKIAKGGNISAIVSPEMHGLNKEEWKALYPDRRYAHLASVSDVRELHSIVLRDKAQPLISLPVFVGDYGQVALFEKSSRIGNMLSRALVSGNAAILGVGSLIAELPGLGLNNSAGDESKSKALSQLIRIVESMGKTSGVDALMNVQHKIPALPEPALLERANDRRPVRLDEQVYKLLSGAHTLCHRHRLRRIFARFVQVELPMQPSRQLEKLGPKEAAANVG